jgi:hypothetical protein
MCVAQEICSLLTCNSCKYRLCQLDSANTDGWRSAETTAAWIPPGHSKTSL